ncbi:hypothetical protein GC194_07940 [bacterium]|nr:hypothetical protein [bacterium]
MNKIVISDNYLPYFIEEELYVVEEKFKKTVAETKQHLASHEEDLSNEALPQMVNNLLIIIRFESNNEAVANYKVFLTKLLAAAGYNLKTTDVVLMNRFKDMKAKTIINQSSALKVMAFGLDLQHADNFQLRNFNGKRVLIAPPIERLHQDKDKKSKLWMLMKDMFNIA